MRVQAPALWLSTEITAIPSYTTHLWLFYYCMFLSHNKPFPAKQLLFRGSELDFAYRVKSSHYISNCTIAQISYETNVWQSSLLLLCYWYVSSNLTTFCIVWMQWNHLWSFVYIWLVCECFCELELCVSWLCNFSSVWIVKLCIYKAQVHCNIYKFNSNFPFWFVLG